MARKKKEEEILQYIREIHDRSVSQMATGRYAGCWQTRLGKGRNGSKYVRTRTLEEMLALLAKEYGISASEIRRLKGRATPTLSEYFTEWLNWKSDRNGNKTGTVTKNTNDFKKYVEPFLGKLRLDELTTEVLDDWARSVLKRNPMTARRFNTLKIVVTGPLGLAVRENLLSENAWKPDVMDYRRLLKSERKAPSSEKIFYDDEISDLVGKLKDDYDANGNTASMAIIFNFDMGLRVGELSALKWEDVDWKRKTLSIRRQESEGKVEEYVKSDSAAGYRELPLNDYLVDLLKRVQRDTGRLSGFIFSDKDGNRKTASALKKRLIYAQVGKNGDTAGSSVKRIHCQRRTVGTKIANSRGLESARQWLGHTDLMTTLRYIYTTDTIDDLRKCSKEMSALKDMSRVRTTNFEPDSNIIALSEPKTAD